MINKAPILSPFHYAELGYRVLPVQPKGKVPILRDWPKQASRDPAKISEWWTRWPNANIGIVTDDIVVVDIDEVPHEWSYGDKQQSLKSTCAPLQRTPSGGYHIFFRLPEGKHWKPLTKAIASGVDIKTGPGAQVLVSPSSVIDPSSMEEHTYTWLRPLVPKDQLPLPPQWLVDDIDRAHSSGTYHTLTNNTHHNGRLHQLLDGPPIHEGTRNTTLASIAGYLRAKGLDVDDMYAILLEVNKRRCNPPLPEKEVLSIAKSISKYPPGISASSTPQRTLTVPVPSGKEGGTSEATVIVYPREREFGPRVVVIKFNGRVYQEKLHTDSFTKMEKCLLDACRQLHVDRTYQYQFVDEMYRRIVEEAHNVDKECPYVQHQARNTNNNELPPTLTPIEPWPEPVALGDVANNTLQFIRRYMVMPEEAAWAATLWILFTHCYNAFTICPLLAITSPTKGCGKTRLLTLLRYLVPKPLPASNATPASIFRAIEKYQPTLICDELDTYLDEYEELRGIINSGHSKDLAFVLRAEGEEHEPKVFTTWAPKAIAKIGEFPPTIADRSIIIKLQKKMPNQEVPPVDEAAKAEAETLRRQIARAVSDVYEQLSTNIVEPPRDLPDRMRDNWTPLFTIAGLAGPPWPALVYEAVLRLNKFEESEQELGIHLLADVRMILSTYQDSFISSDTLLSKLLELEESPWSTITRGSGLTKHKLSKMLKTFGIQSKKGYGGVRGYSVPELWSAIDRYVPQADNDDQ